MSRPQWEDVEKSMIGQWRDFLITQGISEHQLNGKHQPCPSCGGRDRFRFDDKIKHSGDGGYLCSQCGSGNGANLYMICTGVDFVTMINDCASYLNFTPVDRQIYNKKIVSINLPLGGKPMKDIEKFISECEKVDFDGDVKYFRKREQIVILTDVNCRPVTLAIIRGKGFDIEFHGGRFIYGSCAIFGKRSGKIIITSCWWDAIKLDHEGFNVCCIFNPLNMHFIYKSLSMLTNELHIRCNSIEDLYQAESLNLDEADWNGKKVNITETLNKIEEIKNEN